MSSSEVICSHCETPFNVSEGEAPRCPACMRSQGVRDTPPAPVEGSGWARPLLLCAIVAGIGLAIVMTQEAPEPAPPAESPPADTQASSRASLAKVLPEVDPGLRALDTPSAALIKVAAGLEDPLAALSRLPARLLPPRSRVDPDAMGAPRSPDMFIPAFQGVPVPTLGSFEWMTLAGTLLKAKNQPAAYGFDGQGRSRCALEYRDYLLRGPSGHWINQAGAQVPAAQVVALSRNSFLANALAWQAFAAASMGDGDKSSQLMGQAIRLDSKDVAMRFTEGRIQVASGLSDRGFSRMEAAAKEASDGQAYLTVGRIALAFDAYFRAMAPLRRALEINPKLAEAHVLLAEVTFSRLPVTGETQKPALLKLITAELDRAAAIDPKTPGLKKTRGELAGMAADVATKKALFLEEVADHPAGIGVLLSVSRFLASQQDLEGSIGLIEAAIAQDIYDPRLYFELGTIHMTVGEATLAQESADPALTSLGQASLKAALKAFKEALRLGPEHPQLRLQLAQISDFAGDDAGVEGFIKDQINRFPKDPQGYLVKAQVQLRLGDFKGARKAIATLLVLAPEMKEAALFNYFIDLASDTDPAASRQQALKVGFDELTLGSQLLEAMPTQVKAHVEIIGLMDSFLLKEPANANARMLKAVALTFAGRDAEAKAVVAATAELASEGEKEAMINAMEAQLEQARLARKLYQANAVDGPKAQP